ncbi:MAG: tyrosine-type recombinase/integrase [bacterium]|nr:tyrosine-type recombinase/integrase [bacterium]
MRLPGYRRKTVKGIDYARVTINGREHLLGRFDSEESRKKYAQLIAEYLSSKRDPTFGVGPELSLTQVGIDYSKWSRKEYSGGGDWLNIKPIMKLVIDLCGHLPAKDFGAEQFIEIRDAIIASTDNTRQTVNKKMKRVLHFTKWAVARGKIPPENLTAMQCVGHLKLGRTTLEEAPATEPVDPKLVEATQKFMTPVLRDMVWIQRLTGCRPGEVVRLTPSMIDRSSDPWVCELERHKRAYLGKRRVLYLGPRAQQILMPYLLRPHDKPLFSPAESEEQRLASKEEARTTPASCGNRRGTNKTRRPKKTPGDHYTTGTYARAIQYACKRGQLQHWCPNQLRHYRATEIRKEHGLEAAQVILGHSRADVTQIYAQRDDRLAMDVAQKYG